jgi:hypothetical protein
MLRIAFVNSAQEKHIPFELTFKGAPLKYLCQIWKRIGFTTAQGRGGSLRVRLARPASDAEYPYSQDQFSTFSYHIARMLKKTLEWNKLVWLQTVAPQVSFVD